METRIEKRRRQKRESRIRFYKFVVLSSTLLILYFGIKIVNDNIIYLEYFNNPTILKINLKEKKLDLFGQSYTIDLKILKKVINWRPVFTGLLFYI